jgi:hypothetical protein
MPWWGYDARAAAGGNDYFWCPPDVRLAAPVSVELVAMRPSGPRSAGRPRRCKILPMVFAALRRTPQCYLLQRDKIHQHLTTTASR